MASNYDLNPAYLLLLDVQAMVKLALLLLLLNKLSQTRKTSKAANIPDDKCCHFNFSVG
jgi:hypothetical protein